MLQTHFCQKSPSLFISVLKTVIFLEIEFLDQLDGEFRPLCVIHGHTSANVCKPDIYENLPNSLFHWKASLLFHGPQNASREMNRSDVDIVIRPFLPLVDSKCPTKWYHINGSIEITTFLTLVSRLQKGRGAHCFYYFIWTTGILMLLKGKNRVLCRLNSILG